MTSRQWQQVQREARSLLLFVVLPLTVTYLTIFRRWRFR